MNVTLNPVSEDEHVPVAEIYIRTIKERSRFVQKMLPSKKVPGQITMELVSSCVFWLNICSRKLGVSDTTSLRIIITGLIIDYNNHCKLQFGEYEQNNESHNKSTGTAHTIGSLALQPTGNEQGGVLFL